MISVTLVGLYLPSPLHKFLRTPIVSTDVHQGFQTLRCQVEVVEDI